jgi:hypothetical protein
MGFIINAIEFEETKKYLLNSEMELNKIFEKLDSIMKHLIYDGFRSEKTSTALWELWESEDFEYTIMISQLFHFRNIMDDIERTVLNIDNELGKKLQNAFNKNILNM